MKTEFKTLLLVSFVATMLQSGCARRNPATESSAATAKPASAAATAPAAANAKRATAVSPPAAPNQSSLTNLQDKAGYAIGMSIGTNLKRSNFEVNLDELAGAIKDVLAGRDLKLNDAQAREALMTYQQQRQREVMEKNEKEGRAFIATYKTKEGVKALAARVDSGKMEEMPYRVLTEGTGETPKAGDLVSFNYRATLVNGKEFDSSAKRGAQPMRLKLPQTLCHGVTEALQVMKVGSKWEICIPAGLAFGDRGSFAIEPGSTAIYELELLATETPPPPKPVTSDIIRVPSAEEMQAGAKVEVIKQEDAEKQAAAEAAASKTNSSAH